MTDLTKVPLPRVGQGVVTWPALQQWMQTVLREIAARQDARNPNSDFAGGILANVDGTVTVGTDAYPSGRTANVPTLVNLIDDDGRAQDQTFIWPVTTANRNSVQSVSDVLEATTDDLDSEIAINAHSVKFDFGVVAYGSGTITGLDPETVYYVYADDPDYAGGAVSYFATSNPDNLIEKGRYYVGYVATPVTGTTGNVTGATSAHPIVITTDDDHGWSSGDEVTFASMPGDFAVLNTHTYTITVVDADEFSIAVDGSAFGAYSGPAGTATRESATYQSGGGAGAGVGGGRFDLVVIP